MAPSCEIDKLLTKSVPHIIENIFLSLDFKSFLNCLEVNRSWKDMLTSESFQRMGKSVFYEDIKKEILQEAKCGNTYAVRRILSSRLVDMNNLYTGNGTPLHVSACRGYKDVVKLLLDGGMDPNYAYPKNKSTPLHLAANMGRKDVVQLLLDRGAEPNKADDKYTITPLYYAAREGHKVVVQLLLDRGADPEQCRINYMDSTT